MQLQFTNKQIIFLAIAGVLTLAVLLIFFGGRRTSNVAETEIEIWGVDEEAVWASTIINFKQTYPTVRVTYKKLNRATYEEDLLNELAAGRGPDIFMFDNNWLLQHKDKIVPVPENKMGLDTLKLLFPQAVEQDLVFEGRIYALPLYIDTLFMVYNRDSFDQAGIVLPPETWAELDEDIKNLRELNEGELTRPAFAIGGSSANISNAPDILNLLLIQMGVPIVIADESDLYVQLYGNEGYEGNEVLDMYTRHADPTSETYTWNDSFRRDIDSFAKGDVAGVFIYSPQLKEIQSKNSLLDITIGPMPQFNSKQAINYPDYYGLAVSNKLAGLDRYPEAKVAWDFVIFATTDKDSAEYYVQVNDLPPALRFLIDKYKDTPGRQGILARQALTARSWLQPSPNMLKEFFNEAIEVVTRGSLDSDQAIERLEAQITNLLD
ncbi:extracellular solute-binding protein [Patescibacteria group bacterium]|nr:extracellular solute-binding protein [Patescibacteria group bacterium]